MGSGGGFLKTVGNIATGGILGALSSSKAQKDALNAQTEAMEKAQKVQSEAQEKALKQQEKALQQQELAQEQINQANEKASRATANNNRDSKETKNSADLTGGIAKKASTQGASLGSDESLGLDDDEDWFK